MKAILANKLVLALISGVVVAGAGAGIYFGVINKSDGTTNTDTKTTTSAADDNFQRTGQNSFGLAVCDEMTKDQVSAAIGKPVLKTEDYSNNGSTGCKYYVTDTDFVIIDVGFSDMANKKKVLTGIGYTAETNSRIKLENMLIYSGTNIVDVYMNIAPGQKFVRVGRSTISAVDEEHLIKLAMATETKIRSYK
jgi:hypothetical protein